MAKQAKSQSLILKELESIYAELNRRISDMEMQAMQEAEVLAKELTSFNHHLAFLKDLIMDPIIDNRGNGNGSINFYIASNSKIGKKIQEARKPYIELEKSLRIQYMELRRSIIFGTEEATKIIEFEASFRKQLLKLGGKK
ncbi:MAG: hypothetical protein WC554_10310 [Clostridia bacterium]|jgi:hypothetical protein